MSERPSGASAPAAPPVAQPSRAWPRVFVVGLALWLLSVLVTFLTSNTNLIPTIVLLGSFLVPVTVVTWGFEQRSRGFLSAELILVAFVIGGVLGTLGSALLEAYLLHPSLFLFLGVGLIEEGFKLALVVWLGRNVPQKMVRDGVVLGAAVGFGFAAFESAGYALNALFTIHGLSLRALVETEILRGVLAPLGHGLWTAILGGILFGASHAGRFRFAWSVVLGYLGVSVLHALWDSMHTIAVVITLAITGITPSQALVLEVGFIPTPTDDQVLLLTLFDWGGLALISAIGVGWLLAIMRQASLVPVATSP
jgi:RsiW-degrading membrane proteinase PrsW (M82 family)